MPSAPVLRVDHLRCEYLRDPLGIDTPQPRLSWQLHPQVSAARGVRQTAYRILVASSEDNLQRNRGDNWDSGVVQSDQSVPVEYAGWPLESGQPYWWKVCVWDQDGVQSPWSETASWSMGLLRPEDRQGKWIGLDGGETTDTSLASAQWIWFPETTPGLNAPPGKRYFRRTMTIPTTFSVTRAAFTMTADDSFTLFINGKQVCEGRGHQNVVEADVSHLLQSGKNCIAVQAENGPGLPDNPAGLIGSLQIDSNDTTSIIVATDSAWRCAKTEPTRWRQKEFNDSAWEKAKALGPFGTAPWGEVGTTETRRLPARYVRREFRVEKAISRATAYVCGLGVFEFYLNGRRVSDHVMDPALSNYGRRVFYSTFDVTQDLKLGANVVGMILGNGRFFAPRTNVPYPTPTFGYPKLLLHMNIEYEDGSKSQILSDAQWKITADGPIRSNNEFDGEEYDARREFRKWSEAGFDDDKWQPVQLVAAPHGRIMSQMLEPMRITEVLKPVGITNPKPGVYLLDFGQNLYGMVRLKVNGPAGTRVRIRTSFTRKPDGMIKMEDNRSAKSTDVYILRGGGEEVWAPRFRGQGTRYAEITGWPGVPTVDDFELLVVHTDLEKVGDFNCSDDLINSIYGNVVRSTRMQQRSTPLDPDRDERQPWLGHPAKTSESEAYLYNVAAFYRNFLAETRADQREDGNISDSGSVWAMYSGNPIWPSVITILPDWAYRFYGDRRFIEENYETAKKWMLFQQKRSLGDDFTSKDADGYGDWVDAASMDGKVPDHGATSRALMNTAYIYHNFDILAEWAAMLGKEDEATSLSKIAGKIKGGFHKRFFDAKTGTYESKTQCSYLLPLTFGLVPPEHEKRVSSNFIDEITKKHKGHTSVGLTGMQWFMQTLTSVAPEVAHTVATRKDRPSWGYMVRKGGTSMWERWDQDTRDPGMNGESQLILAGNLGAWMYQVLGGINYSKEAPGFKQIVIRPHVFKGLTFVNAWHECPYGRISSSWKLEGKRFTLDVEIPANTTATVFIPAATSTSDVMESGVPAAASKGVRQLITDDAAAIYEVGSGSYSFSVIMD